MVGKTEIGIVNLNSHGRPLSPHSNEPPKAGRPPVQKAIPSPTPQHTARQAVILPIFMNRERPMLSIAHKQKKVKT